MNMKQYFNTILRIVVFSGFFSVCFFLTQLTFVSSARNCLQSLERISRTTVITKCAEFHIKQFTEIILLLKFNSIICDVPYEREVSNKLLIIYVK